MKRRLLNLAAAASLVWGAATVVLWAASCFRNDYLICSRPDGEWLFANMRGQLRLGRAMPTDGAGVTRPVNPPPYGWTHRTGAAHPIERLPGSRAYVWGHGFGLVTGVRWQAYRHELLVPHWFAAAACAAAPLAWYRGRLTRRRQGAPWHCPACGYDLRATPQRCPECGRPAACPPGTEKAARDRGA